MRFFSALRTQKLLSLSLLLFTLSIGILIGTLINSGVNAAKEQAVAPDATPLQVPSPVKLSNEFTKLAQMMEPTVVYISTNYTAKTPTRARRNQPDQEEDEEGMDFFRFFRGPVPNGPQRPPRREGTGSGFIVDKNGYIITNHHVVDKADEIKVRLPHERTEYAAKVIGMDPETDLAVIKIDAGRALQPARIGNSESVQVGDWAVAIGSPFGLEASVTAGIVSATGRDVGAQQFQRFIQTDAAINPGNSGGPLVNINGEVIGVNTMIATQNGGYQGIGFALPVNMAVKVYNQLIQHGRVTRGSIGISFNNNVRPETFKALGLKGGVIVDEVTTGGPAEKAGLKRDDVVIAVNGAQIKDGDDLVDKISDLPIGSEANVTLERDGKRMDRKVVIADRLQVHRDSPRLRPFIEEFDEPSKPESVPSRFGIGVRNLTETDKEQLKFNEPGIIVTSVEEGSFAESIGLQERDIIVRINRETVSSVDDLKRVQGALKAGDAVAFRVMRSNPLARRSGNPTYTGLYLAGTLPK
ncbi:MAG: Do family serine endopeptidase [Bryobacteraceae bacterium]|nr:Do family serine endopeptidase [Bryobacteraceae bacterium]